MTPDEAHRAIQEAEAMRANIPAYCWRALEFIAGMREEWGVVWPASKTGPEWIAWGFTTIEDAYEHVWDMTFPEGSSDTRFVRRYVTTEEEA